MSLKILSGSVKLYGAIAVLAFTTISPAYADEQNLQDPLSFEEIALAQNIGSTHASFDICKIADTNLKQEAEEAMTNARIIVVARYKQLGRSATSAANREQQAYNNYQAFHKQVPGAPACKLYQRQIDALTWSATEVAVQYIQDKKEFDAKRD